MKPQIIRSTIVSTHVCAPATMPAIEIEAFVNERSPLAGVSWRLLPKSRVPCDRDERCVHVVLEC